MTEPRLGKRLLFLAAALLALASLACFAIPIYVIRPFRHQGSSELAAALFVKRIGPWLSIVCAALCAAAVVWIWKSARSRMARAVGVVLLVIAAGGAYLARLNVYEFMFHPIDVPRFDSAEKAHVDAADMVIAIQVNGDRRAYPIREIAYHHVVNDTVGGEP